MRVVKRKFEPFDALVINREFMALPTVDAAELKFAMQNYQDDLGVGYTVRNYGDGLLMLKPSSRSQGRCLFFYREVVDGVERLVALLIYKKESQEVPVRILKAARERREKTQ